MKDSIDEKNIGHAGFFAYALGSKNNFRYLFVCVLKFHSGLLSFPLWLWNARKRGRERNELVEDNGENGDEEVDDRSSSFEDKKKKNTYTYWMSDLSSSLTMKTIFN